MEEKRIETIEEELHEIKMLLQQLLEEQKWTNENIITATEILRRTTIAWGN